jgi:3-dehydroquinate synthase
MKSADSSPIQVRSRFGDYSVLCEPGLLRHIENLISPLGSVSSVHLLSSPRVWKALGKTVVGGFHPKSKPQVHLLDDSETAKTLRTVEKVLRSLVRAGADRHSLIIAVGGGVIGDMAGFAAASYLRGVSLVQVPTTLVAQVDSAIGGKTGVNLPEGKNLVGAFHPGRLVLVDPEALATLPDRQIRSGLAEVIKYGVIADPELFAFLEANLDAILGRDSPVLLHTIRRSMEIKADVVSRDERESSLREILNFGHTFGHALEAVTKYRRYQHGEAVAWGMICAALLAHETIGFHADSVARLITLIRRIGPLPRWPKTPPHAILDAMRSDKKTHGGKIRFVLSSEIGKAATYDTATEKTVLCVLRFMAKCSQQPENAIGKCHG